MKIFNKLSKTLLVISLFAVTFLSVASPTLAQITPGPTPACTLDPVTHQYTQPDGTACLQLTEERLGFRIPNLTDILTFAIRGVFIFGGLAALFYLLLGAFAWITSGGEKDKVHAAQQKIQAAVLGVIMIAVVLAIVVTLEQFIFAGKICLGISCQLTIPSLLK